MATVAIISDIHANVVALDAVLADLDELAPDQVVCLGDIAATGPAPREVLSRLRGRDWRFVRGNCEDAMLRVAAGAAEPSADEYDAIDRWCAEQLEPEDLAFIATFDPVVTVRANGVAICCYHGSPHSNLDEILPTTPVEDLDRWFRGQDAWVYAGGHTHVQMARRYRDGFVINPGSIGLPFTDTTEGAAINPLWAEYAVLQFDGGRVGVEMRRVPVEKGELLSAAAASGMPCLDWWSRDWA
jgi:predicted phosphodiesterase